MIFDMCINCSGSVEASLMSTEGKNGDEGKRLKIEY